MSKILLIESDGPFAQELSTALEARGLEARVTADGKEGLDLAKVDRPDLIVLCVELPKMSGYSVCNKLKKDDQLKSIPLVIISAEATTETFEQHRKLKTRAEGYLIKPFHADSLLKTIEGLIEMPPEPTLISNEELVTLDDVDLEVLAPDAPIEEAEEVTPGSAPSEDEDLKLLDEAFESLSSEEPAAAATETPVEELQVAVGPADLEDDDEVVRTEPVVQTEAQTETQTEVDKLGDEADAALAALGADEPTDADLTGSTSLLDEVPATGGADGVDLADFAIGQEVVAALGTAKEGAGDSEIRRLQDRVSELLVEVARKDEALELRGAEATEASARLRALEAEVEEHRTGSRRTEEQARTAAEEHGRAGEAARRAEEALRVANERALEAGERARALEAETKVHAERAQREEQARRLAETAASAGSDRARAAEERTRVAEERARVAEERTRAAEERTRAAENGFQAAEERVLASEQRTHAAETRASTAEARTSAAEARAETAEQESAGVKLRLEEVDQACSLKAAEAEQARERAEGLGRELDAAHARAAAHENDLATLRPELEVLRTELSAARAVAEGSQAESESKLAELRKRVAELEVQNTRHEERVVKAYQKIKGDEKIREKTRKALAIALQLLEERPQGAPPPAEVQPRRE
jgi:CheY-like chemotaxis protein